MHTVYKPWGQITLELTPPPFIRIDLKYLRVTFRILFIFLQIYIKQMVHMRKEKWKRMLY